MEIEYDFDRSLRMTDVGEDFDYSPSTGLHVFRHAIAAGDADMLAPREAHA